MAELQAGQREQIKEKLFAIPPDRYPIHDVEHARNALVRVRQFGTPEEKSKVYAAVTKRYPALATRSEVVPEKKQRTAEKKLGLGAGEESQKVEPAKQKLSSVAIAAFVDEIGQIKEAALPLPSPGELSRLKGALTTFGKPVGLAKVMQGGRRLSPAGGAVRMGIAGRPGLAQAMAGQTARGASSTAAGGRLVRGWSAPVTSARSGAMGQTQVWRPVPTGI